MLNSFSRISCFLSISLISIVLSSNKLLAQNYKECHQIYNPSPGDTCVQRVFVEARHIAYGDGVSVGNSESTSTLGWGVISWKGPVATSNNNGSANLDFRREGSSYDISTALNEYDRSLRDVHNKVTFSKSSFEKRGMLSSLQKSQSLLETINKSISENEIKRSYLSRVNTNVDVVTIRARAAGRCTRKVFGTCVDNAGGWYKGYVDVYKMYLGNPDSIKLESSSNISRITRELEKIELDSQSEKPSTASNPPNSTNDSNATNANPDSNEKQMCLIKIGDLCIGSFK